MLNVNVCVSTVAVTAICALMLSATASADTYVLQPDGTGDFTTIQLAVSAVQSGDIIELAPGTYDQTGNRDVDFFGKAVTIRGQTGDPADVIIDCQGSEGDPHRGFIFSTGEGPGSVIQDLTVTNAYSTGHGGAIYCHTTSPTIDGCVFDRNTSEGSERYGGAIYCTGESSPTITGCTFTGNKASEFSTGRGGAIACRYGADATLDNCFFEDNFAEYRGGAVYCDQCDATITDCVVKENQAESGAGVYVRYGTFVVTDCLVIDNRALDNRGGGLLAEYGSAVEVGGCTFVGNLAPVGGGMYVQSEPFALTRTIVASCPGGGVWYAYEAHRDATVSCCNVFDNEGGNYSHIIGDQTGINDNISVDPQFCDEEAGDFRLFDTSPCSAELSPCGLKIGAYGVVCDSPVEQSSWGKVKAMYK